jgi:hypothetical protein
MTTQPEIREIIRKLGKATRLDIVAVAKDNAVDAAILGLVKRKDIGYRIVKTKGRGPNAREYFII